MANHSFPSIGTAPYQSAPPNPEIKRDLLDLGADVRYWPQPISRTLSQSRPPPTYNLPTRNVSLNRLLNVTCYHVAVEEVTRTAPFYRDSIQSGALSMMLGPGKVLEAEVPVKPLFDIVDPETAARVGFIKVDVEGFEHIVMRQILDHIDRLPVDVQLTVEYGPKRAGDLKDVLDLFRETGFRSIHCRARTSWMGI